jgi:hypothetical protein
MKPFFSIALLFLCTPLASMARTASSLEPVPVFVDSQDDFSGYIIAALTKKGRQPRLSRTAPRPITCCIPRP